MFIGRFFLVPVETLVVYRAFEMGWRDGCVCSGGKGSKIEV